MRIFFEYLRKIEKFLITRDKKEGVLLFISFISLRFFFEPLLEAPHAIELKFDFILHYYLFFIALFLFLYPYIRFFFEEKLAFSLLCHGFFVIILPPFIDFLLSKGKGYVLMYVKSVKDIPSIYLSLFTSPHTYTSGATPGVKFEVLLATIGLSIFIFYKLKGKKGIFFALLNILIFPLFPLLLSSIFTIKSLYSYTLSTPIFVFRSTPANTVFIILITLLLLFNFRRLFPKKITLISFFPPFLSLVIILFYSIKISEFIPKFLFLPGNIIYILLSSFSVFLLFISFQKDKIYFLTLFLSFLYVSVLSKVSIISFLVFLIPFYLLRMHSKFYFGLFLIYSIIQGASFFALGGKIPFPEVKDNLRRYSAEIYKREKNYLKSFKILGKIEKKEFFDYLELSRISLLSADTFNFYIFFEMAKAHYIEIPPYYKSLDFRIKFWELEKEKYIIEKDYKMLYVITFSVMNSRVESEKILSFLKNISPYLEEKERLISFLSMYGY